MHCTIPQATLNATLKRAVKFLSTKPQLPILSCFYIEVTDSEITLIATDLHMGIKEHIQGQVVSPGVAVIPAKIFSDLISTLSGPITLQLEGQQIEVTTEKARSVINTFPEQDFPPFPQKEGDSLKFSADMLKQVVDLVSFASSRDETKPILTSLLFDNAPQPVAVSTDGYRLAKLSLATDKGQFPKVLFPARAFEEVIRMIDVKASETVEIALSEGLKQAFFTLPSSEIVIRTMEGNFPPYQNIIPQSFAFESTFDTDELEHLIKSAMLFSKEGSSIVQITLEIDQIEVKATSSLYGEFKSSMPAKNTVDSPLTIAFNGRFILDFLQKVKGKTGTLKCNDPLKPVVFGVSDLPGYSYLAMPFRMNG